MIPKWDTPHLNFWMLSDQINTFRSINFLETPTQSCAICIQYCVCFTTTMCGKPFAGAMEINFWSFIVTVGTELALRVRTSLYACNNSPYPLTMERRYQHLNVTFVAGCTANCQCDIFRCRHWWQLHQNYVSFQYTAIISNCMVYFRKAACCLHRSLMPLCVLKLRKQGHMTDAIWWSAVVL